MWRLWLSFHFSVSIFGFRKYGNVWRQIPQQGRSSFVRHRSAAIDSGVHPSWDRTTLQKSKRGERHGTVPKKGTCWVSFEGRNAKKKQYIVVFFLYWDFFLGRDFMLFWKKNVVYLCLLMIFILILLGVLHHVVVLVVLLLSKMRSIQALQI